MERITLKELIGAVGGELLAPFDPETPICAVNTDSRRLTPGSVFIPLVGERFDGHSFLSAALEGGAVGCLTQRLPETLRPDRFYVKVVDTTRALGDLARWYKDRFRLPFVCVTGSVGKTTTKDMLAAVLGEQYRVLKTEGNFNNNIGVPLTLLRLERSHQIAVLEMGMNHAGEIGYLTSVVRPDTAVITNVGDSHIENLGSREGIFRAKCEIFLHMVSDGWAVLNGDDRQLATLRGKLPFQPVFAGTEEGAEYRAVDLVSSGRGISFTAVTPNGSYRLDVPAPGRHMVYPALMAAAVGEKYGLTPEQIARGVAAFKPTKMRMNVVELPGGVTLLNDAYNANPQSMAAAAAVLADAPGRKVAVLGDMLELGEDRERFHREVGEVFAAAGADKLIAVGALARHIAQGADGAGLAQTAWYSGAEAALEEIRSELRPGATILVKASRAMHFEKIVDALTNVGE